jgi:hypothetical protein
MVPPRAWKSAAKRASAAPGSARNAASGWKKPWRKIGARAGSSWRSSSAFSTSNLRPRRVINSRSKAVAAKALSVS